MPDRPGEPPPDVVPSGAGAAGKTCPSGACQDGSLLLGIMTSSGRLAYLNPPVAVDADFVDRERSRGNPERRFRFADACVECACPQWTGEGCAIADLAADAVPEGYQGESDKQLPSCSIRRTCRWFAQRGPSACLACPMIVADMGGTQTYRSTHPTP